jgi:hypothetical protein
MGKVSIFCIIVVFALLLEDGSSVRKKTEDEKKEDEDLAKMVNMTLAEEEKKRLEEKKKEENGEAEVKKKKKSKDEEESVGQGEDCPTVNFTCPELKPCQPCKEEDCPKVGPCPEAKPCEECPEVVKCPAPIICPEVGPCEPCGPCPPVHCKPCNETSSLPQPCHCLENGLTVPVALIVGTITGLVAMGVATALGFLLRYAPPVVSGLLFLSIVLLTWFLSSRYPDVAREAGGRLMTVLREATVALGHRIMETLRHQEQVGLLTKSNPLI